MSKTVFDTNIIWLLSQVIDNFHIQTNVTNSAIAENLTKSLPLGNLTSQLLVNVYMNEFDQFVKRELKVKYYIRYADDFVILSDSKDYLKELIPTISIFLEKELKLQLHPDKVFIKMIASGVDFLGWVHFPEHRVLRTSTKRRMLKNLKNNPKPETMQSYLGMLKHGNAMELRNEIESCMGFNQSARIIFFAISSFSPSLYFFIENWRRFSSKFLGIKCIWKC